MSDLMLSTVSNVPLLFWVGGSALGYIAVTNILWWIRATPGLRSSYGRASLFVARFLYYLVVPYLVLGGWPRQPQQGLLALEDLGLVGLSLQWPVTRWLEAAGTGLGLGLLALLILGLAWINALHLGRTERDKGAVALAPRPLWDVLLSGLYLEVHWAFYRGGLAVALGDIYGGVFWGLAAACLERLLNPFWRAGWRTAAEAGQNWLNTGLALTSSLLFLLTRNLWICLAVHWLLALAFWSLASQREGTRGGRSSVPGSSSGGLAAGRTDEAP